MSAAVSTPTPCGKCGAALEGPPGHFAVRVGMSAKAERGQQLGLLHAGSAGPQWIARFTYPSAQVDKAWEASEGIRVASACTAILGEPPYLWTGQESARFVADSLDGEAVPVCDACVPKPPKATKRARPAAKEEAAEVEEPEAVEEDERDA